jgi:transcriptional regulator with XRE-family HTH domain
VDIAKRILELCEAQKISIYRLADKSDITQSTLQNIVSGRNTDVMVGTIEKICLGLNMTLAEFFSEGKPVYPLEALEELKSFEQYLRYKYGIQKPS